MKIHKISKLAISLTFVSCHIFLSIKKSLKQKNKKKKSLRKKEPCVEIYFICEGCERWKIRVDFRSISPNIILLSNKHSRDENDICSSLCSLFNSDGKLMIFAHYATPTYKVKWLTKSAPWPLNPTFAMTLEGMRLQLHNILKSLGT